MSQRSHTISKDTHQIVIKSVPGDNPADFSVILTNPIKLDPNKHYVIGLHNAILTASWNTAPVGVAYNINGVDKTIPQGHYTFTQLKEYVKADFELDTVAYLGKILVIVSSGDTLILQGIAEKIGFITGTSFTQGAYLSPNIANMNPVNFISVHSNLIDINSTRSNGNVRPLLRTALVPPCLDSYEYFDLCATSEDYYVKCVRHEINSVDIRVSNDTGFTLDLNPAIPTFWTLTIKEIDLM